VKVNVDPSPTWLLTQISPPCSTMNFRESDRPRPVPSTFLSRGPDLAKFLEHRLMIFWRDADPGVGDRNLNALVAHPRDLMVALQEEADPQRTILPLAADLQNESHDMRRRRVGVMPRAALAVSEADQPCPPVASAPAVEDRPRNAKEPAGPAHVLGYLLVVLDRAQPRSCSPTRQSVDIIDATQKCPPSAERAMIPLINRRGPAESRPSVFALSSRQPLVVAQIVLSLVGD
jgi:hypothetical protein